VWRCTAPRERRCTALHERRYGLPVSVDCDERSAPRSTLRDVNEPLHDEVLDGLPVLSGEPSSVSMFPAPASHALMRPLAGPVQTVAAAAGGFVAGAAVLGLVHRRHSKRAALASPRSPRRIARPGKRSKSVAEVVEVIATRSLLVDVHLLASPDRGR
jgi:hypothetical protein